MMKVSQTEFQIEKRDGRIASFNEEKIHVEKIHEFSLHPTSPMLQKNSKPCSRWQLVSE